MMFSKNLKTIQLYMFVTVVCVLCLIFSLKILLTYHPESHPILMHSPTMTPEILSSDGPQT
jgi:hypothetical protein